MMLRMGGSICHLHLIILFAFVLASVPHLDAFSPVNCSLKISNELKEDKSELCVAEYLTADCREFVEMFNQSLLPEELRNALSIERPTNLFIKPALNFYSTLKLLMPGMIVSWESPQSGMARSVLKGFLMTYLYKNSNGSVERVDCRLFQFSKEKRPASNLLFSYNLEYARQNKNYVINVYSLPPPSSSESTQSDSFLESSIFTGSALNDSSEPSKYRPSVALSPEKNGKLLVSINLSPPAFNFTVYSLKLKKKSDSTRNMLKEEKFVTKVQSAYKQFDTFTFDGLPADEYSVVVRPTDIFDGEVGKCLCWSNKPSGRYCEFNCDSVESNWVRLEENAPVIDKPDIYESTSNTANQSTPSSNRSTPSSNRSTPSSNRSTPSSNRSTGKPLTSNKVPLAVIIVLAVISFVIFVAIFIFINSHHIKDKLTEKKSPPKMGQDLYIHPDEPSSPESEEKNQSLTTKTVYILSSMDHTAHEHLVEALAKFLNVHCYCKVIYAPWHDVHREGDYTWLVSNMSRADIILFVDSEGAEKLMNAYISKKIYRSYKMGPEGDLFTLGSKRILSMGSNPEVWETIVPVSFSHDNWCRKYLLSPMVYKLPHNLPLLLQKIHRLSSNAAQSHHMHLPLCVENLTAFTEGAELLSAIQSSEQYASDNPDWLHEQFGEATPIYTESLSTNSSGDSDYASLIYNRTISVSTQDVSFSDTSGSPVSMMDRPVWSVLGRQTSIKSLPCNSSHQSLHPLDDGYSVVTVGTDVLSTLKGQRICPTVKSGMMTHRQTLTEPDDGYHCFPCVLPPEPASAIHCDSVSTALKGIDCRTEAAQDDSHRHVVPSAYSNNGSSSEKEQCSAGFDITPPNMSSDILSESLSMGFRKINTSSEM